MMRSLWNGRPGSVGIGSLGLVTVFLGVCVAPTYAQEAPTRPDNVTFELTDATLKESLNQLFKVNHRSYRIGAGTGRQMMTRLTLSKANVPFETALKTMLSSVKPDLTYHLVKSVYVIEPAPIKPDPIKPDPGPPNQDRPAVAGPVRSDKMSLELKEADLPTALTTLFSKTDVNYLYVLSEVPVDRISFEAKNVPLEGALVSILRSVDTQPVLDYHRYGNGLLRNSLIALQLHWFGGEGNLTKAKVTLRLKNTDLAQALIGLFRAVNASYTLGDETRGQEVTLTLTEVPFEEALNRLLKQSPTPVKWTFKDNVYRVEADAPLPK